MEMSVNKLYGSNVHRKIINLLTLFRQNQISTNSNSNQKLHNLQQIHSFIIKHGFSRNSSLLNNLLFNCLYIPSFPCTYASSLFNQIKSPNILVYNIVIRGFLSEPQKPLLYYTKMRQDGIFPNKHTFPLLLKAKSCYPFQLLAEIFKLGFDSDRFVCNSLISTLAGYGFINLARQVFDELAQKGVVAYTALMYGYVRNSSALQALELFVQMRLLDVRVDEMAVVSAFCAVGILGLTWFGKWIHGFYVVCGKVLNDVYVGSALINMYAKCGYCDDACRVFEELRYKNLVSWTALLAGYVQWHRFKDALDLFQKMLSVKLRPNEATLTSALTACANLGALDQGRWIENYVNEFNLELSSALGTALIDMYGKCGCVKEAYRVFNSMLVKDVFTWTAMIFGLAVNGDSKGSLNMFSRMLNDGVKPNEVTFIAVLSACSHGGLVKEGQRLFTLVKDGYGIVPSIDHYGCMVDLLGRAGLLDEAIKLIMAMPMEPNSIIWGALFGACMIHKNYELGETVGNHLIMLQPNHSGRYSLLANLYSKCGNWGAMARVRKKMNVLGIEKTPGCSWIELCGVFHEFVAFDKSHVESESLYRVLDTLLLQ